LPSFAIFVIFVIVILNAIIVTFQEVRAESAIAALRAMTTHDAHTTLVSFTAALFALRFQVVEMEYAAHEQRMVEIIIFDRVIGAGKTGEPFRISQNDAYVN
jgi:ribosomal protein L29